MNPLFSFLRNFRDKALGLSAIQARFDILQSKIDGIEAILQSGKPFTGRFAEVAKGPRDTESDEAILARSESILLRAITLGKKGQFKVAPQHISISATSNCNLRCVMCLGHTGNTGPLLSTDEADLFFSSLGETNINYGRPTALSMTGGESTLNPNLATIFRRFKELFPDAKISMISNATIPLRGQVREAFELADRIGLSMDGATAETFERIRKGAIYKNVVRNVQDVAKLKTIGVNCETLQLMFVAMDQNIHELPEMVRFAHSVGIPEVFVQISEVRNSPPPPYNNEGQNITLSLSSAELIPFLREAKSEADRLGICLSLTSTLQEMLKPIQLVQPEPLAPNPNILDATIRTCNVPWIIAPGIGQDNIGLFPLHVCCHMPHEGRGELYKNVELRGKPISEIFNSKLYWDLRAGLLDGSLARTECKGCQYYKMYQWTALQLRELETATARVENLSKFVTTNQSNSL